ncbi:hypothetical protein F5884DRAFT_398313 [Xylogone sp. PMI_703]|nr:hypothetical protein F5884DRAFT_398313 [Xylogone sp. PMI_703]
MRGGGETETTLFGYTGKLHITGAKESFRQAALRLVYRDRESNISGDWEFAVDIRDSDSTDNTAVRTVTVTRTKFNETFKEISQHFADKLFIRGTGQPISTSLEPRKASSIVNLCLHQSPDVAYWIVPDDLRPIYGINQLQESFSAALRVLGFNKELQLGSVSIDGIAMGWAATDITTPLWNSIKQKIVAQDDGPVNLEVQVSPKINHALSGIRLVGTNDSEIFQAKELKTALEGQIYQNMLDIAERQFSASAIVAFKLQSCLRGKPRTVCFKKAPQEDAISSIKSLLKGLKKDDLLSPLIFWLTYDRFTVYDVDNPGLTVSWVTESSDVRETLEEFRLCLGKLWKDYDGNLDLAFCLVQPETDLRFYITGETTEQHWTENVLRWVQSPRLWVKRRGTCKYDVLPLIQAFEQEKKLPNDTLLEEQQIRPPDSATLAELPGDQVKTPVNKTIGDLQKESYTRLVSTVEPGFTPSVPVQSPPRENPVSTGLSPALYANQIAAAETTTTFSENFSLRNTVLNRISRCPVCGDGLDAAKPKDSEAHFQAHRDREVATGSGCPLCRDPRWSHMAAADQKAHIDQHYMSYVRDQLAKAPQGKQQTDITIQNTSTPNRISVTDAEFQRMSGEYHRARSLYQSRCPRCNIDLESMPLDMETEHVFACLKKLRPEKDTATSDPKPTSNKAPKSTTTTTTQKPSKPTSKDAIKSTANDKQTTKPGSRKQKPSDNDPTYKPSADGEEDESDDDAPLLQKIAMPFRVPRANDIPADTIVVSPRARAISTAGSGRKRKLDSNASSARKKKQI